MPRAVCAPAMTLRFTEVRCAAAHMGAALQGIFVGQGPRALPGSAGKIRVGPSRTPVPTKVYLVVRRGYKRHGEVKNPPVTASPCQPPLGKGVKGMGDGLPQPVCALASQ